MSDLRLLGQQWFTCPKCLRINTKVMIDPATHLEVWGCTRRLLSEGEARLGIRHLGDDKQRIFESTPVMQCQFKKCGRIFHMTDRECMRYMPSKILDRYPVNPEHGMESDVYVTESLLLTYQEVANCSSTNPSSYCMALRRKEAQIYEEIMKVYHRDVGIRFTSLHARASDEVWEALTAEERLLRREERRQFLALPNFESLLPELSTATIKELFGTMVPSDEQLAVADKKKNANERMIHTLELQNTGSGTHLASDFCPALGKLFQLPPNLGVRKSDKGVSISVWCAQTQNTGEITTLLLVPSESYANIQPGVRMMAARRDGNSLALVAPVVFSTDDQPNNREAFFADIPTLLAQTSDLRHVLGRVIELGNKFSQFFSSFCQRFSQCFLIYSADDVRNQLKKLLNGGMAKGGKIMIARKPNGKADMHTFKEEGELAHSQLACTLPLAGLHALCRPACALLACSHFAISRLACTLPASSHFVGHFACMPLAISACR